METLHFLILWANVWSILGYQPAISTLLNKRPMPLTAGNSTCIPCEDSVNDTNSDVERQSSTYTRCGDAIPIPPNNDTFGNAHSAYMLIIVWLLGVKICLFPLIRPILFLCQFKLFIWCWLSILEQKIDCWYEKGMFHTLTYFLYSYFIFHINLSTFFGDVSENKQHCWPKSHFGMQT